MLSGNGRHRRPRQAPAALVAAGVTGSAIAIPLLGATGASAADTTTWDHVAECESGGSWSVATGNGRYGGLQLSQADWDRHGGLDYAPRADQASRSQQIAVAERVLAERGASAWSGCGHLSGLNERSGSTHVDTGIARDSFHAGSDATPGPGLPDGSGSSDAVTPSPSSPAPSDIPSAPRSSPSSKPTADPSGKGARESGKPSESATEGDNSDKSRHSEASSSPGVGQESGGGRHRGGSADEIGAGGRSGDSAGRHVSRDSHAARGAFGDFDGSYTVRPGDSLSVIADSHGLHGGWGALYDANKKTVGADPDLIHPGQNLDLKTGPTGKKG